MKEFAFEITISNNIKIRDHAQKSVETLPYGYINSVRAKYKGMAKFDWQVNFPKNAKIVEGCNELKVKSMQPRKFQQEIVDNFKQETLTGSVHAPTGSGKTNIMGYLIAKRNVRTVVIVPTSDLVDQTYSRFLEIIDIEEQYVGRINSKNKDFGAPILICTWQSFNTEDTLKEVVSGNYAQVICDEWHKASADVYNDAVNAIPALYKHGFSASPYRNNDANEKKMKDITGDIFQTVAIEDLYKEGFLIRPTIVKVKTGFLIDADKTFYRGLVDKKIDNEKYRWVMAGKAWENGKTVCDALGNPITIKDLVLNEKYRSKLINEAIRVESSNSKNKEVPFEIKLGALKKSVDNNIGRNKLLENLLKSELNSSGERAVILFNTVAAAEKAKDDFSKLGSKNVFLITGKEKNKSKMIENLKHLDEYYVFGTIQLLGEGIDIPSLEKIFVYSPAYPPFTDSARLQQIIGRPVRPYPGMSNCYVYLFDDDTDGWITDKKNKTYSIVESEMHPKIEDYDISKIMKVDNIESSSVDILALSSEADMDKIGKPIERAKVVKRVEVKKEKQVYYKKESLSYL